MGEIKSTEVKNCEYGHQSAQIIITEKTSGHYTRCSLASAETREQLSGLQGILTKIFRKMNQTNNMTFQERMQKGNCQNIQCPYAIEKWTKLGNN